MGITLQHDGKQLLSVAITFVVLSTVAVLLRLLAKFQRSKDRFSFDDVLIFAALIVNYAFNAIIISSESTSARPFTLGKEERRTSF